MSRPQNSDRVYLPQARNGSRKTPIWERLSEGFVLTNSGCWEWQRARNPGGYAVIRVDGISKTAHRVSYTTFVGPIPEGLTIDHLCGVKHCVNPSHMELVTARENTLRRGTEKLHWQFQPRTECPQGHPYTEENTWRGRDGERRCRSCKRAAWQRWYRRFRAAGGSR